MDKKADERLPDGRHEIGIIGVDAGLCWVGDPCYVLGDDASSRVCDWSKFCDLLHDNAQFSAPLGYGTGFAVSTGYGDGSYPVTITVKDGCVTKLEVDFCYNSWRGDYYAETMDEAIAKKQAAS